MIKWIKENWLFVGTLTFVIIVISFSISSSVTFDDDYWM